MLAECGGAEKTWERAQGPLPCRHVSTVPGWTALLSKIESGIDERPCHVHEVPVLDRDLYVPIVALAESARLPAEIVGDAQQNQAGEHVNRVNARGRKEDRPEDVGGREVPVALEPLEAGFCGQAYGCG